MGHRQRWYVTETLFEVTIRTLGGKFWLRPDAACKAIIEGVFGKALKHYDGIHLHAYDAQSNHLHFLLSATDPAQVPLFLDFVHGNIARQINALRGRRGTFWSRRGAVIAVLDPKAQVARLRYLLAQGPAAGLVCSPTQWPGASSTRALLDDLRVSATYVSLDKQRRNAALQHPRPLEELGEDVSFDLAPLPAWADLTADERKAKVAELIDDIVTQHKGKKFLGARALRTQSPDRAPKKSKRSPMPRCHASTAAGYRRYTTAYREFRTTYLRAAERLRNDRAASRTEIHRLYPPGSLARPGWYIPTPANFQLPWLAGASDADEFAVAT
jgi:putative transposase